MTSLYNWYRNTLRHPQYRWWLILGTVAYLLSPIDISPDFIPIAGQIDDVMLATLLVTEVSQLIIEKFKARQETVAQNTADNPAVDVKAESV